MSKKKHKHKNKVSTSISLIKEVDKTLNYSYEELLDEIENMQIRIAIADRKARKIAKKRLKKKKHQKSGDLTYYETNRRVIRNQIIDEMEGTNFLERVSTALKDIKPIIVLIARLVASLILAILSFDQIKINMNPKTLDTMTKIYEIAMAIS